MEYTIISWINNWEFASKVKIASFDLDDTLVKRNNNVWNLSHPNIPSLLDKLTKRGYVIAIFTNRSGLNDPVKINNFIANISDFLPKLAPLAHTSGCFIAIGSNTHGIYRKPNTGMWDLVVSKLNRTISNKSFFCGDAAGRSSVSPLKKILYKKPTKGDFADTDYKFALNIGIKFITPETFLGLDEIEEPKIYGFNPQLYLDNIVPKKNIIPNAELIVMMGYPGSGKSFYCDMLSKRGYTIISKDGNTPASYQNLLKTNMAKKAKIVIDNTHPDYESRKKIILMALDYHYNNLALLVMNTDLITSKHMANTRNLYGGKSIPDIVYKLYQKKYTKPSLEEGWTTITELEINLDEQKIDPKWMECFMILS
jgi:bifunctional polynucleotide phosphatase/kinase